MKSPEQRGEMPEPPEDSEEQELVITLSKDATFVDLFKALNAIEEEGDEFYFEEELYNNFDSETADEVLSFEDIQRDKAATTKVIDFFEEHGYTQDEISAYLSIEFK